MTLVTLQTHDYNLVKSDVSLHYGRKSWSVSFVQMLSRN